MSTSSWSCLHFVDDKCFLLNKACKAGQKGCVLHKKTTFSEPSFLHESFDEKMERKMKELIKKQKDDN